MLPFVFGDLVLAMVAMLAELWIVLSICGL
jgi:hypothetical protein